MSYRIGELAELAGMTVHGLRFYEKEGLVVPERKGNKRIYSEEDRLWIEFLVHMKETGMSVLDMKKYTDFRKRENPQVEELMNLLLAHREKVKKQLSVYQKNLDMLNEKIDIYQIEIAENKGRDLFDTFAEKQKRDRNK
ncbi:MerR family transcriptional regulator [Oceanobacillus sp. FSL K6-3682]|uniref:MerR family transcriptional regulator n=1 Tax=Oceanobacillus sp. FSL K6-3682 TaxID=2921503 RepID=UPI000B04D0F1